MPSGGHNRKPRSEKIIEGTFKPSRNPENEPEPEPLTGIPEPPEYLCEYARVLWYELAPILVGEKLLTSLDLPSFEILCGSYGQVREAMDVIYKDGQTLGEYFEGKNSQTTPEFTALKEARQVYKSFMAEFGLSPASRNRIDIKDPKGEGSGMGKILNEEIK